VAPSRQYLYTNSAYSVLYFVGLPAIPYHPSV
jgi:hypothetical protein